MAIARAREGCAPPVCRGCRGCDRTGGGRAPLMRGTVVMSRRPRGSGAGGGGDAMVVPRWERQWSCHVGDVKVATLGKAMVASGVVHGRTVSEEATCHHWGRPSPESHRGGSPGESSWSLLQPVTLGSCLRDRVLGKAKNFG